MEKALTFGTKLLTIVVLPTCLNPFITKAHFLILSGSCHKIKPELYTKKQLKKLKQTIDIFK